MIQIKLQLEENMASDSDVNTRNNFELISLNTLGSLTPNTKGKLDYTANKKEFM
jgi:hypothetical protein